MSDPSFVELYYRRSLQDWNGCRPQKGLCYTDNGSVGSSHPAPWRENRKFRLIAGSFPPSNRKP